MSVELKQFEKVYLFIWSHDFRFSMSLSLSPNYRLYRRWRFNEGALYKLKQEFVQFHYNIAKISFEFHYNIQQSWRKLFFSVWHWVRQELGFCLTHGLCVCPTIFCNIVYNLSNFFFFYTELNARLPIVMIIKQLN